MARRRIMSAHTARRLAAKASGGIAVHIPGRGRSETRPAAAARIRETRGLYRAEGRRVVGHRVYRRDARGRFA